MSLYNNVRMVLNSVKLQIYLPELGVHVNEPVNEDRPHADGDVLLMRHVAWGGHAQTLTDKRYNSTHAETLSAHMRIALAEAYAGHTHCRRTCMLTRAHTHTRSPQTLMNNTFKRAPYVEHAHTSCHQPYTQHTHTRHTRYPDVDAISHRVETTGYKKGQMCKDQAHNIIP